MKGKHPIRQKIKNKRSTIFDFLVGAEKSTDSNKYCAKSNLSNEASVENFFTIRLLKDLGYNDDEIKPKESIETLTISRGRRKEPYKPDYAIVIKQLPRFIIDAKAVTENVDNWIDQCSGYAYALNRKYTGDKPLLYYIITNGMTFKLFNWDQIEPILKLEFSDFNDDNQKFLAMRSLISADIIRKRGSTVEQRIETIILKKPSIQEAKRIFNLCHRLIWKTEKMGPTPAFFEFVKIMFVKLLEDKKLREDTELSPLIKQGRPIPINRIVFSSHWIETLEKSHIENPINDSLFNKLTRTLKEGVMKGIRKPIFEEEEEIKLQAGTIKMVVSKLENYDMFGIDDDLNGRLFETFLSATMRGEALGQYFTPRSIVKLMEKLVSPSATRSYIDKVLDGCCGTGGFLIEVLADMRRQVNNNTSLNEKERINLLNKIANESIYGVDAGSNPPIARIARINMYLHGDGGSRIYSTDFLDKSLSTSVIRKDQHSKIELEELRAVLENSGKESTKFNIVLTNPPFSMDYSENIPDEYKILNQYNLSTYGLENTKNARPSLRSALMFIERYADVLEEGGELVTIIDDSILSGKKYRFAREFIREKFIIKGIVSLPGDAFQRVGSRVKTSILYLIKRTQGT